MQHVLAGHNLPVLAYVDPQLIAIDGLEDGGVQHLFRDVFAFKDKPYVLSLGVQDGRCPGFQPVARPAALNNRGQRNLARGDLFQHVAQARDVPCGPSFQPALVRGGPGAPLPLHLAPEGDHKVLKCRVGVAYRVILIEQRQRGARAFDSRTAKGVFLVRGACVDQLVPEFGERSGNAADFVLPGLIRHIAIQRAKGDGPHRGIGPPQRARKPQPYYPPDNDQGGQTDTGPSQDHLRPFGVKEGPFLICRPMGADRADHLGIPPEPQGHGDEETVGADLWHAGLQGAGGKLCHHLIIALPDLADHLSIRLKGKGGQDIAFGAVDQAFQGCLQRRDLAELDHAGHHVCFSALGTRLRAVESGIDTVLFLIWVSGA